VDEANAAAAADDGAIMSRPICLLYVLANHSSH
jgi:hypothetical protein